MEVQERKASDSEVKGPRKRFQFRYLHRGREKRDNGQMEKSAKTAATMGEMFDIRDNTDKRDRGLRLDE